MSLRLLQSINIKATLYYIIHRFLDSKYRAIRKVRQTSLFNKSKNKSSAIG